MMVRSEYVVKDDMEARGKLAWGVGKQVLVFIYLFNSEKGIMCCEGVVR
jgi:hypothetical protein